MTPERLRQVRRIFDEVVALPMGRRSEFLNDACAGDDSLAEDLRSLLAYDDVTVDVLENMTNEGGIGLGPALEQFVERGFDLAGHQVGKYRLEELVGVGGMGVVYRATCDGGAQTVALKLIRPGLATPPMLRRLREEARVLARLQHACIARILEAGTAQTRLGPQPFFAMEFVRGEPLTVYANNRGLSIPERLKLFARVCDGVQHAHQRGVIHRDLKPANILINQDGDPKIIDFGVARITDIDVQTIGQRSTVDGLVGTLRYMSPEQLTNRPDAIDIRSDIYTLGVVLYELLANRPPYDLKGQSMAGIARAIEERPPLPMGSIDRACRGDLETIAAKALDKDRTRRFQSAYDLSQDVRRHLRHEPIAARPSSVWYRLRKYARRNPVAATAIASAILLFFAAVAGTALGMVQTQRQSKVAAEHLEVAEATAAFLDNMLESLRPEELGRDVLVRDVLDQAAETIQQQFDDRPLVLARLHRSIGASYGALGELEDARRHLEQAVELTGRELAEQDERRLASLISLAVICNDSGHHLEAETLAREVWTHRDQALGPDHVDTLNAQRIHGVALLGQERYEEAERVLEDVLERSRFHLGPEHDDTVSTINGLTLIYSAQERLDEAEPLLRAAVEARSRNLGPDHPRTLTSKNNLALHLIKRRHFDEAETLLVSVLASRRQQYGDQHPKTLTAQNNLGNVYYERGQLEEAEPFFLAVEAARRRVLGIDHPRTVGSVANLAMLSLRLRRLDRAQTLYEELRDLYQDRYGDEHSRTIQCTGNLATVYRGQGDLRNAVRLFEETLDIRQAVLGPEHPRTQTSIHNVAMTQADLGHYAEAESMYERVLDIRHRRLPPGDLSTMASINGLACLMMHQGRFEEAETLMLQALAGRQAVSPKHPHTVISLTDMARLYLEWERPADARPYTQEAVELAEDLPHRSIRSHAIWAHARQLAADDDPRAEAVYLNALDLRTEQFGPDHPGTARLRCELAELCLEKGREEDAEGLLEAAYASLVWSVGVEHPWTVEAGEMMGK